MTTVSLITTSISWILIILPISSYFSLLIFLSAVPDKRYLQHITIAKYSVSSPLRIMQRYTTALVSTAAVPRHLILDTCLIQSHDRFSIWLRVQITNHLNVHSGAFAMCEKWLLDSSCLSVCPHGVTRLPRMDFHCICYLSIFRTSVKKVKVSLKLMKVWTLKRRNVSDKSCRKNENILC